MSRHEPALTLIDGLPQDVDEQHSTRYMWRMLDSEIAGHHDLAYVGAPGPALAQLLIERYGDFATGVEKSGGQTWVHAVKAASKRKCQRIRGLFRLLRAVRTTLAQRGRWHGFRDPGARTGRRGEARVHR